MKNLNEYKLSRYNLLFEYKGLFYIYNSFSNALANLEEEVFYALKEGRLGTLKKHIQNLIKGNFIVEINMDEIGKMNVIYESRKWNKKLSLTIAPTLQCNCRCEYCFQEKSDKRMESEVYEEIYKLVLRNFISEKIGAVDICWYGGEPLLEKDKMLDFSKKLAYIIGKDSFNTMIVTNGILLDRKFIESISKYTKISRIQITIDGEKEVHNKKRTLKSGVGTYDEIIESIMSVLDIVKIALRINIDKESIIGIENLFNHLKSLKLNKNNNLSIYFGHLRNYTSNVKSDSSVFFTSYEFARKRIELLKKLREYEFTAELYPSLFPFCMLDHYNSFVLDPEGNVYKCWDLIGQKDFSLGNIKDCYDFTKSPIYYKFLNYNPLDYEECRNCMILPNCLGGCGIIRLGLSNIEKSKYKCMKVKELLLGQLKYKIDSEGGSL